jgi:hypothetical protein
MNYIKILVELSKQQLKSLYLKFPIADEREYCRYVKGTNWPFTIWTLGVGLKRKNYPATHSSNTRVPPNYEIKDKVRLTFQAQWAPFLTWFRCTDLVTRCVTQALRPTRKTKKCQIQRMSRARPNKENPIPVAGDGILLLSSTPQ